MMTTITRLAACSMLAGVLAAAGCGGARRERTEAAPGSIAARTAVAELKSVAAPLQVDGTVVGRVEAIVSSRLAAPVASVETSAGAVVRQGQALVRLDARETEGALDGARAALESARSAHAIATRNRERFESLARREAAAAVELDRARLEEASAAAQEAGAAAALRRAETDIGQAVLRAPFDAVVVDKMVTAGDLALPGRPLVRLASLKGRRVEASVPEDASAALAPGQAVTVLLGSERLDGRLAEVVAASDPGTRRRTIRVDLPAAADPAPGTFARVLLAGPDEKRLLVPASAVTTRGGLSLLFVVTPGGEAVLRYVQVGAAFGEAVEIRSGVTAGERVVTDPPSELVAGMKVTS